MRYTLIIVLSLAILGCSSQLGYRFADTLVMWKLEDLVELTDDQHDLIEKDVERLHQWHATSELPRYRNRLLTLRDAVANETLTEETLLELTDAGWMFWDRIRLKVHPLAQERLPLLSEAQVEGLIGNLQEELDERKERAAERAEEAPEDRQAERRAELEADMRDWVGRLRAQQRGLAADWLAAQESGGSMWLEYRQAWLDAFAETLRKGPEHERYAEDLGKLILKPQAWRSEVMLERSAKNTQVNLAYVLKIEQSLSRSQRERVVSKIDAYIEDIEDIVAHFSEP